MGMKVPGYERFQERKFLESSQELSFSGNESSRERKSPGTRVMLKDANDANNANNMHNSYTGRAMTALIIY